MRSAPSSAAEETAARAAIRSREPRAVLRRLGPADRALLELRHRHQLEPQRIAEITGLDRDQLAMRLGWIVAHLRSQLAPEVRGDEIDSMLAEALPAPPARRRPPGGWGLAASLIVRFRFAVIAFWIAAAVAVTLTLPTIREAQVGALGDLVPHDAAALDAELRSSELFRFPLLSRTLVVQRDADGLSATELARSARRAFELNRGDYPELRRVGGALPVSNVLGKPPFSRERSTTAITYLFFAPDVSPDDREILANRLIERRIEPHYDGFVGVTGASSARSAQAEEIERALPLVELGTVLLVALVVGLYFRAVGAPLATLLAVAIAYLVSIRLIAYIGQRIGVSVPSEVEPVIVVLLFGIVTDYSIFFLSRMRRRLAAGEEPQLAAMQGTAELLPIIVTAGITVVSASAALVVAKLGFFQAFGPGTAMAVLIGLLVAVTLIPAVLAVAGRALFWPRRPGAAQGAGGLRGSRAPTPLAGAPRGDGAARADGCGRDAGARRRRHGHAGARPRKSPDPGPSA